MAKPKKGIISGREAERRASKAHRKDAFKKAKKGDQAAVAELASGAEQRTSVWKRLLG